jgi:glycosyltransferase involved in cell wall biosynthesis
MVLVTEDWFALSHFKPLIGVLTTLAGEVIVVTRSSGRISEIKALGARAVDFDFRRSSTNPVLAALSVRSLARLLRDERPDAVHLVAMKPIVVGSLALALAPAPHAIVHMTGLGLLGISRRPQLRLARAAAMRVVAATLRRPTSFLLVENPDDLAFLRTHGADPGARYAILGGAGVDPQLFTQLPAPRNQRPVAAYVGRMIRSKGVDVLMSAYDRLGGRGADLALELCGRSDDGNLEAVPSSTLRKWCARSGAVWRGHVADVLDVWRRADIFVLPARGGEGLPRALLEAAACARPLLVTDVPGCRHFVRDGVEGLIVPPGDSRALADALERLARDPEARIRFGHAARMRVLSAFTETHVRQSLHAAYSTIFGSTHPS